MNEKKIRHLLKFMFSFPFYYLGLSGLIIRFLLRKGLYIFNYHSFNTFTNDYFEFGSIFQSDYQDNFEKQIRFFLKFFSRAGVHHEETNSSNGKSFMVTFDDGYRDHYILAFPVLKKLSIPAIFFVPTIILESDGLLWHDQVRLFYELEARKKTRSPQRIKRGCKDKLRELKSLPVNSFEDQMKEISAFIGKHERLMMNLKELQECYENGIIIAPHTHSHSVLSRLEREQKKSEISKSIEVLRSKFGIKDVFDFSVPDGKISSIDEETLSILRGSGLRHVYLTEAGINRTNRRSETGCQEEMNIRRRIGINPSDPLPVVALKIIRANLA